MINLKYFSHDELKCNGSGECKLGEGFGEALDWLRETMGEPMHPTSVCRSFAYNQSIGGHPRSLHVCDKPYHPTGGTIAADIRATDPLYRTRLIKTALTLGWSVGVNIPKGFVHIDRRDFIGKPQILYVY